MSERRAENRTTRTRQRRKAPSSGTPPKPGPDQTELGEEADLEARLDAGLEETFPASDPVSVNSRSD
jgi:hypothetical protein